MSEPTPPTENPVQFPDERIEELNIERELQESYLTYAMSTIMDRALPDVRDGLKPSQRRILVAMNDLNLTPGRKHLKCAKIAGNTSGDYHPHGESIVYPTLVRMAQDWSMRYVLIDGQGNFGSSDGDNAAAMRYTEARMAPPMAEMLADLEKDTVDYQPNYDERPGMDEPTVLPAKFPNLLVNGSTGIAVGMACNLLPHNLREICDGIIRVIDNADISLGDLMTDVLDDAGNIKQLGIKGPDFPAGGIICGIDGVINGYNTGRSKLTLRCKLHVEEKGNRKSIVVDEMPYGVIRKSILETLSDAAKNDRIKDVSGANDESGRLHKCRIVIDLKRDADPDVVINQLYQYTPAQITVSMINIALVNRQPRTMGIKELIQHFIGHRFEVITRRTRFLLKKAKQRGHILEGLIFAVCDIDEVIRLIKESKTREEAIQKLRERAFRIAPSHPAAPMIPQKLLDRTAEAGVLLTQVQAEAIGRLQLIQLVGLEIEKLTSEYREVVEEIEGYEKILADDRLVYDIIREDTLEIRDRYGDDRRTEIDPLAGGCVDMEALIAKEDVVVTVSHNGYVKRLRTDTYRSQSRGGRGIKGGETREGDFVEHLFIANTHDYLMFFTNKGRVYERRVFDVPEMSRTSLGRAAANLMDFQPGEKIASVLAIKDFETDEQCLMFATQQGVIKKTLLKAYANILNKGIIAIGLEEGDALIGVDLCNAGDQILLGTHAGMAIRFNEGDARAMGRPAGGVKGIELESGDSVVSMIVIHAAADMEKTMVLTGCENGYGKRTPVSEYRLIKRGGKGVINIKSNDRNGPVVGMNVVGDNGDIMLISEKGILIRTRVSEIRETGRNAAGVKLINLGGDDRLVAMACVATEPDEPDDASPAGTDGLVAGDAPPAAPDETDATDAGQTDEPPAPAGE